MLNAEYVENVKLGTSYINFILQIARQKILNQDPKELAFDPQGRLLVNVTLTKAQAKEWLAQLTPKFPERDAKDLEQELSDLEQELQTTKIVSLDIMKTPLESPFLRIESYFYRKLEKALLANDERYPASDVLQQLWNQPRGSIIPLQQELHFHLALAARLYQKVKPELMKQQIQVEKAHKEAMLDLNNEVMHAYAKAIKLAMKSGTLDSAVLNKELDKARKELVPLGHKLLRKHLIKNTGVVLNQADLNKLNKKLAEATTASPHDVIHTNKEQHLVTLIRGSENTAHDRRKTNPDDADISFAHRGMATLPMNEDGQAIVHQSPRIQIRTPSPVVKKGLNSDKEYIADVVAKLKEVNRSYSLDEQLALGKIPRAFIYNSYTAFHNSPFVERLVSDPGNKNRQTQSARHILLGAHQYNKDQQSKNENPIFCFVQNISVNGFGNTLAYGSGNDLREETTLMADMALMHTLYDTASAAQKPRIEGIMNRYKLFLKSETFNSGFFSKSPDGVAAKGLINHLKQEWRGHVTNPSEQTIQQKAKWALKNLIAHDLHHQHQYSKLVQALSVFCEEASIGGCKSGNERAQAINGRVAVFDHLLHHPTDMPKLDEQLGRLASAQGDISKVAKELNQVLNEEYNKSGLQTAASVISLLDQGGPAKVKAKKGFSMNTNYAEESASVMSNLHQKHASAMQAHKGFIDYMKEAWGNLSYSSLRKDFAGFGFLAPIIAGVATFFSFLFGYQSARGKAIQKENEELLGEYAKNANGSYDKMHEGGLNPEQNARTATASSTATKAEATIAAAPVQASNAAEHGTDAAEENRPKTMPR